MVDLRQKPYYLNEEQVKWVEDTIASMTVEEKIGQLFVDMLWGDTDEEIKRRIDTYGISGFRYNNLPAEDLYHQNEVIQRCSRVPALIAANVGSGCDRRNEAGRSGRHRSFRQCGKCLLHGILRL